MRRTGCPAASAALPKRNPGRRALPRGCRPLCLDSSGSSMGGWEGNTAVERVSRESAKWSKYTVLHSSSTVYSEDISVYYPH